jgi:hypothetical protein
VLPFAPREREDVVLPLAAGVTELGENFGVAKGEGTPAMVNATAELKPPWLVTVIVSVVFASWANETELGEAARVKVGVAPVTVIVPALYVKDSFVPAAPEQLVV